MAKSPLFFLFEALVDQGRLNKTVTVADFFKFSKFQQESLQNQRLDNFPSEIGHPLF